MTEQENLAPTAITTADPCDDRCPCPINAIILTKTSSSRRNQRTNHAKILNRARPSEFSSQRDAKGNKRYRRL